MASTSVVLPWSTCAMIAMLRILELKVEISLVEDAARRSAQAASTTVLWRPQSGEFGRKTTKEVALSSRWAARVQRADAQLPAPRGGRRKLPGSCLRPGPRRRCSRKIRDRRGRAGAAV